MKRNKASCRVRIPQNLSVDGIGHNPLGGYYLGRIWLKDQVQQYEGPWLSDGNLRPGAGGKQNNEMEDEEESCSHGETLQIAPSIFLSEISRITAWQALSHE